MQGRIAAFVPDIDVCPGLQQGAHVIHISIIDRLKQRRHFSEFLTSTSAPAAPLMSFGPKQDSARVYLPRNRIHMTGHTI